MEKHRHTQDEIDLGLTALVVAGGNSGEAARQLKAAGTPISERNLRRWRDTQAGRYHDLQTEHAPRVTEIIASTAEALAIQLGQAELAATQRFLEGIGDLKASEAAAALRNISTAKALQIDKLSSPLRGRPSRVIEHLDPQSAIRGLARDLGIVLDATADDITDVQTLEP